MTNDSLMGSTGRTAKFETHGDKVVGKVLSVTPEQQKEFGTGTPMVWQDSGKPMMQWRIELQTDERVDDDDDGVRLLFVKGSQNKPESSRGAVVAALRAAGAKDIEIGGTLHFAYTGDGVPSVAGYNPPKQFKAKFERSTSGVTEADIF